MSNEVVPVNIRGIVPNEGGCTLFLGNDDKVFVIHVDRNIGEVIANFINGVSKERPLTHDLINHIFKGFGISLERVVITALKNGTYYARLILRQQNDLGQAIVEVDARPSDCLALATSRQKPVYVARALFDQLEDVSEMLERLNEAGPEPD
jgi:bifunctional DNase/RNase